MGRDAKIDDISGWSANSVQQFKDELIENYCKDFGVVQLQTQ